MSSADGDIQTRRKLLRAHAEIRSRLDGIRALLEQLPLADREALRAEIHETAAELLHTANSARAETRDVAVQTFSAKAKQLLESSPEGIAAGDMASQLYPDRDPAKAKKDASTVLSILQGKNQAHQQGSLWFFGPSRSVPRRPAGHQSPRGRKKSKNGAPSVAALALRAFDGDRRELSAADVLAYVREKRASASPPAVYAALNSYASVGKLKKRLDDDGRRAYYTLSA